MNIRIYQIDTGRDSEGVAFCGLVTLRKKTGRSEPDGSCYDPVYEGEVDARDLEDVYDIFNCELPDDYEGRSMSVSDVVEVTDSGDSDVEPGFYFCDTIGFEEVKFDPPGSSSGGKIRVIAVEPGRPPCVKLIRTGLESLQAEVDGYIEVVYPYDDPVGLIVNEEGKINGLPLNRALRDESGEIYDIIAGTFLVAGLTDDDFRGLSDAELKKYMSLFAVPEMFVSVAGRIHVLPCRPADDGEKGEGKDQKPADSDSFPISVSASASLN
ncbi:MAG: DUF3846 domain-containing protein [Clostridia bacterium]|nr:DUF3846 domain-containing protein [Clostridia bacterium]